MQGLCKQGFQLKMIQLRESPHFAFCARMLVWSMFSLYSIPARIVVVPSLCRALFRLDPCFLSGLVLGRSSLSSWSICGSVYTRWMSGCLLPQLHPLLQHLVLLTFLGLYLLSDCLFLTLGPPSFLPPSLPSLPASFLPFFLVI